MYGLLLPLDIKELSTKEIEYNFFDQSCKSQLNLIFHFIRIPPRFVYTYL